MKIAPESMHIYTRRWNFTHGLFGAITFCELHWCEIRSGERSMGQIGGRAIWIHLARARLTSMYIYDNDTLLLFTYPTNRTRPCVFVDIIIFQSKHGALCGMEMHRFIVFEKICMNLTQSWRLTRTSTMRRSHNEPSANYIYNGYYLAWEFCAKVKLCAGLF